MESHSLNGTVERRVLCMAATAALVLILALPAIAPHGVDATSVVATNHGKPEFKEGDFTVRTVPEGTPSGRDIGNPVSATDPENDTLTYLLGGMDASLFEIVTASGQLQTKANLDQQLKTSFEVLVGVMQSPRPSMTQDNRHDQCGLQGHFNRMAGGWIRPAPVAPSSPTASAPTRRGENSHRATPSERGGRLPPDGLGITTPHGGNALPPPSRGTPADPRSRGAALSCGRRNHQPYRTDTSDGGLIT